MGEFVHLWIWLQGIHLQPGKRYAIKWRLTDHGQYTCKSAHLVQFRGSYETYRSGIIWKTRVENKFKFFVWTLVQNKILTADNLAIRGWPHHQSCLLCNSQQETGHHLYLSCPFGSVVWTLVLGWYNFDVLQRSQPSDYRHLIDWWQQASSVVQKVQRRQFNGIAIYIMWNVWKD